MSSAIEGRPAAEPLLSKGRFYLVIFVLLLADTLSSIEHSMLITALPTIVRESHDIGRASWVITAYLLAAAASAAVGGRLGDMFGRKRVLLVVIGLCAIGSVISSMGGMEWVIFGRAIQGASGAILPLCYGITRRVAPAGTAPFWVGILTGGYASAAAVGFVLGGYFAEHGDWRHVFHMTAIYSVLLLPLVFLVAPDHREPKTWRRFDYLGAVLLAPAVAAMLYGLTEAKRAGWGSPQTLAFVLGGGALLAFWGWYEYRREDPLIQVRLLATRPIALGNTCAALFSIGMTQIGILAIMLMQQPPDTGIGLGLSPTESGLLKIPAQISIFFAASLSGYIALKRGARWSVFIGGLTGLAAWTSLTLFHASFWEVILITTFCSFATGLLHSGLPNLVLEGAPPERSSEVTGLTVVVRNMFSAIGAQTVAVLLATSQVVGAKSGAGFPSEDAYVLTFICIAAVCTLIATLSFLVKTPRVKP